MAEVDSGQPYGFAWRSAVEGGRAIIVARLAAIPLPDPVKQAEFERTEWWLVPVSYGSGAGCLIMGSLLLLPQVREYFLYRSRRSAAPQYTAGK
jgi:hypothetical protein